MPAPKPEETCETCTYCDLSKGTGDKEGECHRNPPIRSIEHDQGVWPVVTVKCWCGEWKRKK